MWYLKAENVFTFFDETLDRKKKSMARKLLSYEQCTNDDSNVRKITDLDEDNTEDDQIVIAKFSLEEADFL